MNHESGAQRVTFKRVGDVSDLSVHFVLIVSLSLHCSWSSLHDSHADREFVANRTTQKNALSSGRNSIELAMATDSNSEGWLNQKNILQAIRRAELIPNASFYERVSFGFGCRSVACVAFEHCVQQTEETVN